MPNSNLASVGAELAAHLPSDDKPWWKKRNLVWLNFSLMSIFLLSSGNGYDGSMLNGVLALPHWQAFMHHPTGAWLGFVSGAQSLGGIFCYPAVAWSSNRFGRKRTILTGYIFLLLGAGLQTGAVNVPMFVVSRIIVGIARSFLAAWATFGTRDYDNNWSWRIPSMLQLLLPTMVLPGLFMIPESPRWLISQERHEEARAVLVKYHAEGDELSSLVAFEYAEIATSIRMENEFQKNSSYRQMLATPTNRKRTFITIFLGFYTQWAGQNVAGYYLSPVLNTIGITTVTKQTLINGFLQLWNLICSLAGAFNVDRAGRRVLFLAATSGMLVSYILITALSATFAKGGSAAVGTAVVPFLFLMYGCFSLAFTPLMVAYPVEIWPYELRSRGLATMWISTAIGTFFNIFVNPIALESIAWRYYLLFVFILALGLLVFYFVFPETRGHSLEEMARVFGDADEKIPKRGSLRRS
ncbi:hypothetical protein PRZ48_012681 [Zasmidium cellare]|uniref:Major facilitator superfamily (MFS) profile domain-containing protein n=1 Tax=Zasmidium cellare TaxID=395010 RepID=A0ABR0E5I5_ZASCE|nr:hypothetical protein PRZ48_012681 [Zasmidium cellare]